MTTWFELVAYVAALTVTATYVIYATRIYLFAIKLKRKGKHKKWAREGRLPNPAPFVSILIPTYNEPNVIDRILKACTSLDYDRYEVIVVDDSDDETVYKLNAWRSHPRVKVIHREHRHGWKGGALNEGLKHLHPDSEFVLIFDADFIPPPDTIKRLLRGFTDERVGAVQGAQWAILNADENWVTRGARVLMSGAYFFDHVGKKVCDGFVQLSGSVMMIRRDVLDEVGGFGTSITEDWELTLKLYEHGYRIVYDEDVRVPCECPSTLDRFIRQQCRWAEGHMRNFRKRLLKILRKDGIPLRTKLDFILVGMIFFQSVFFIIGVLAHTFLMLTNPSWLNLLPPPISLFMFFYCGIAYPLALYLGLRTDGLKPRKKDIVIALLLNLITVPFIAWASLRGLFLSKGHFFRTFKTGRITVKLQRLEVAPSLPYHEGGYYREPRLHVSYGLVELAYFSRTLDIRPGGLCGLGYLLL